MKPVFVHATAIVDDGAEIGEGSRIWHFVHVSTGARVGAGCVLGQNVYVGPNVRIGQGCKIQNNVSVYEGVELAEEVFLGPSCVFTNVLEPRAFVERKDEFRPTKVGRGVTVGANATILCGHGLGAYALVGAGAVVTKDVPAYALVVGNPSRRVGWVCRCAARLPAGERVACPRCGARYAVDGASCHPMEPA